MATVSLKGIKKIYDNKVTAVHDFNLEIADKEFIVLVGPSGCGKSTTLRMVAGLEDISEGDLLIDGKRMNDVEPKDRDIAMVFQNYALYPHMTVAENMAFALKLRKVAKEEIPSAGRRCGSVETCRNATEVLLFCREGAHAEAGLLRSMQWQLFLSKASRRSTTTR